MRQGGPLPEGDKLVRFTHIAITKRKKEADGSLLVWGDITDDSLDTDGERVDPEFAAKALTDWFQGGGAVFNQHCEFYPPAGQGVSLEFNPDAPAALRAHITEPTAIGHVENGVYKDFSVGWYDPEYVPDPTAPNGRMVGGWAREVSLVDAGANKNSHIKGFVMAKSESKGQPPELFGVVGAPALVLTRADNADIVDLPEGVDRFSRALKTTQARRAEKALAAGHWYAAFKRDMDPNVGGGVDRDKLEDSDFVIPDGPSGRAFPIVTPGDVPDAVSSWGHFVAAHPDFMTFEQFKSKLTALVKRKGSAFEAKLPDSWDAKKGRSANMSDEPETEPETDETEPEEKPKAKKAPPAPITAEDVPDGNKICPTCDGKKTIMEGHRKCPDCKGAGHVPEAFVKAKKAVKQDDPNDEVDAAVEDLMSDLEKAAEAQAEDVAEDGPPETPEDAAVDDAIAATGDAVNDLAAAQAEDVASLKSKKAPKARKAKPPAKEMGRDKPDAADEKPNEIPPEKPDESREGEMLGKGKHPKGCDCVKCKAKAKKKATKVFHAIPGEMVAAHDALCPIYDVPAERALKALSSPFFLSNYHRAQTKETPSDVRRAYEALSAATQLSLMQVPTFARIRSAAHKALEAAYPDLSGTGFTLRSPDQFHRPFLPGANDEEPTGGFALPDVNMAPVFGHEDFARLGPVPNQERPSPTPGVPAMSLVGKSRKRNKKKDRSVGTVSPSSLMGDIGKLPKSARQFYTNASKDEHSELAGGLHDLISKMFPGICPMVGHTDLGSEDGDGTAEKGEAKHDTGGLPVSDGLPKPAPLPEPPGVDGKLKPTSTQGADKGKAKKEAEKASKVKRQARELKALRASNKRLKAKQDRFIEEVRGELRRPDPRARSKRGPGSNFSPMGPDEERTERIERVRATAHRLKARADSRYSPTSVDAVEQLRASLPPKEFAALMVADES